MKSSSAYGNDVLKGFAQSSWMECWGAHRIREHHTRGQFTPIAFVASRSYKYCPSLLQGSDYQQQICGYKFKIVSFQLYLPGLYLLNLLRPRNHQAQIDDDPLPEQISMLIRHTIVYPLKRVCQLFQVTNAKTIENTDTFNPGTGRDVMHNPGNEQTMIRDQNGVMFSIDVFANRGDVCMIHNIYFLQTRHQAIVKGNCLVHSMQEPVGTACIACCSGNDSSFWK